MLFGFLLNVHPVVYAAGIEILVERPSGVSQGDTVSVPIILNNNPGITTLGVAVPYDRSVLQYQGAAWNTAVSSNGSNMLLANDSPSENQVNVSAVLDGIYSTSGQQFVTLNFTALQSFGTMPLTVTARDISDSEFTSVSASVVYDDRPVNQSNDTETPASQSASEQESTPAASETPKSSQSGGGSSQTSNTDDEDESEEESNEEETETEYEVETEIGFEGEDDPENDTQFRYPYESENSGKESSQTGSSQKNSAQSGSSSQSGGSSGSSGSGGSGGSSSSGKSGGSSASGSKKGLDSTYKTGAVDSKVIFGGIAILFLAGAGGGMAFLKRIRL